jgi:hypothetical protein
MDEPVDRAPRLWVKLPTAQSWADHKTDEEKEADFEQGDRRDRELLRLFMESDDRGAFCVALQTSSQSGHLSEEDMGWLLLKGVERAIVEYADSIRHRIEGSSDPEK